MNIPILHEDNHILVIDKPANVTVNRSETTVNQETIQDWVENRFRGQNVEFKVEQEDFYKRGGIVHRLDKETSGILLVAKTPHAFGVLQKQFKERTVKKSYVSLAHGKIVPLEGEINVPVGRLPWNRMQFGILPGGRESKTLYKVLSFFNNSKTKEMLTLVELYPQSGRTHQIRVHLKYIGHPVFSDYLYAGRKTSKKDRQILPRVFLHAAKISFNHPDTGHEISFESQLPSELQAMLTSLNRISEPQ